MGIGFLSDLDRMTLLLRYRGFRTFRASGAWRVALNQSHSEELAVICLRHTQLQFRLLVGSANRAGSIDAINLASEGRSILAHLTADTERLQRAGVFRKVDADAVMAELRITRDNLKRLEHAASVSMPAATAERVRASGVIARLDDLIPITEVVPHVTTQRLTNMFQQAMQSADPAFAGTLDAIFRAGPHGADAWRILAGALENRLFRRDGSYAWKVAMNTLSQFVGELCAQSHPWYRSLVSDLSATIEANGLIAREVFGSSLLGGREFRDAMLLAEVIPAAAGRIGRAGLVVRLESRQAFTAYEAGRTAEVAQAASWMRPQGTVDQQIGSILREEQALARPGALLRTPDGLTYELVGVPDQIRFQVLARPYRLPAAEVTRLSQTAVRSLGTRGAAAYTSSTFEIVTPFASEQIRSAMGPTLGEVIAGLKRARSGGP